MKIVVDTNIIFSAILNTNGKIGDLLFNSFGTFEFYSCDYMRYEILKHREKLKGISKLSDYQLNVSYTQVLSKINFINEELIPIPIWEESENLVKNIDEDDIDFVGLTIFLNAQLWTGDKVLQKGLINNNFKNILNTVELTQIRDANQ